jgi:hypothetical protein
MSDKHECMVCVELISRRYILCPRHYARIPKSILPAPGVKWDKQVKRVVFEYWRRQVEREHEPATGMKVDRITKT